MTKWIKLHNSGDFDVVTAISMMGASVKTCDNPIGLYGSGIKYAMAQCLRNNISLKVSDNGKLYTLTGQDKEFRGEQFKNVALKTKTGKMHVTGITSDFGQEDWNDPWFVFREFYSNMLDEKGTLEIVDGVQVSETGVDVFLPYAIFEEYVGNLEDYFATKCWKMKSGSGRVFKRGVWVGTLATDPGLDFQSDTVEITETRTMNQDSAWKRLISEIEDLSPVFALTEILKRKECWSNLGGLWFGMSATKLLNQALLNVFGDNYIISPNVDWIKRDAVEVYNRTPVVLPDTWTVHAGLQTMSDIAQNIIFRDASTEEALIIEKGIRALAWMNDVPNSQGDSYTLKLSDMDIKVLKTDENCGGLAKTGTPEIGINSKVITGDFQKFVQTLMHECIHAITGEGDYTRGFPAFMERALASMSV
tara:strand:+ start:155 stop:1411 length:1257 start_codon:yes stop_codon:yes gene_type:complete